MDDFELSIDGELFRVSESNRPPGRLSYHFAWLNGPDEGTYGFTLGLSQPIPMSQKELTAEAREFVESFYEPGGIGEEDFPDHRPAPHQGPPAR